MELKVSVKLVMDINDIREALAQWAEKRMPQLPGYHVEAEQRYTFEADVSLVKDKEPITILPATE